MYRNLLQLLNIKPNEAPLVGKLFTVQFFLGIATAFYFTSTLSMFISTYKISILPIVYIVSAVLLFGFNRVYAWYEEHLNSPRLLELVILFSAASVFVFWVLLNFADFYSLKIIISAWYMVIYMLVGYAFWGMASIMFNVRESRRLFSIVGAGDIPAKMLGYAAVSALVNYISVYNLLWISIASFITAFVLMKRYQSQGFIKVDDAHETHEHLHDEAPLSRAHSIIKRFFFNKLIVSIALLSILSYVAFAFIDFTFLADIKLKFNNSTQIATFISVFFAIGRFFAIAIKLLFSSRMIARIGLTNALLLTPVLLFVFNLYILLSSADLQSHLMVFGVMVLLAEILRSALQEPVFFILFQPLQPHDRLRGHLVAKGYTLPIALMGVGLFLYFYMEQYNGLPLQVVSQILVFFLVCWAASIFIIKKQYLATLVSSLKKGYFTGAELFLSDKAVIKLLLAKTESDNPLEVVHALNLLERSGYGEINMLLLQNLRNPHAAIKEYVLDRVIEKNLTAALPTIKQQIQSSGRSPTHVGLVKAYYFLERDIDQTELLNIHGLTLHEKKPAIIGLLRRHHADIEHKVMQELTQLANGPVQEKLLVIDIINESPNIGFSGILKTLLLNKQQQVARKAIEAVGKARDFSLFSEMIEVAVRQKAYHSLQRSLLLYGDEVFEPSYLAPEKLPEILRAHFIKAAGRTKGEASTRFLVKMLAHAETDKDLLVEALWFKNSTLQAEDIKHVDHWVHHKIEESKAKIVHYHTLVEINNLQLLRQALESEIDHDLRLMLMGLALLYDRQKIDRVIELLAVENKSRIYNAIEVLELIIPQRYFVQLNVLVELTNDIHQKQTVLLHFHEARGTHILEQILKDNKANFNEWTRSVACYLLPKFKKDDISLSVLHTRPKKNEVLFNETRNYVLSMLK